jgi:hypothetical protein
VKSDTHMEEKCSDFLHSDFLLDDWAEP